MRKPTKQERKFADGLKWEANLLREKSRMREKVEKVEFENHQLKLVLAKLTDTLYCADADARNTAREILDKITLDQFR